VWARLPAVDVERHEVGLRRARPSRMPYWCNVSRSCCPRNIRPSVEWAYGRFEIRSIAYNVHHERAAATRARTLARSPPS
jgi:hypothetical protein